MKAKFTSLLAAINSIRTSEKIPYLGQSEYMHKYELESDRLGCSPAKRDLSFFVIPSGIQVREAGYC